MQKREKIIESQDKAKHVVGETYYIFLEVKIALVLSILLIKNYGGYDMVMRRI